MEISAVWLMNTDDYIEVLIEVDGKWYRAIKTFGPLGEMTISHCVNLKHWTPTDAGFVNFGEPAPAATVSPRSEWPGE